MLLFIYLFIGICLWGVEPHVAVLRCNSWLCAQWALRLLLGNQNAVLGFELGSTSCNARILTSALSLCPALISYCSVANRTTSNSTHLASQGFIGEDSLERVTVLRVFPDWNQSSSRLGQVMAVDTGDNLLPSSFRFSAELSSL